MCATCGCDHDSTVSITQAGDAQFVASKCNTGINLSPRHHHQETKPSVEVEVERNILQKNDSIAAHNRMHFESQHIFAINLVSSPGSGKTSLLERTLTELKNMFSFYVIEGDQQTMNDANRIAATGVPAIQINTGKGCHLDADMVHQALHKFELQKNAIVVIENVGNLVCPAMFDLGENARVAIISVTEGDDKPLKYPDMFASADLCIINKTDLLPYVNFSTEKAREYATRVNPSLTFIELSVTSGEGMHLWYEWLQARTEVCSIL